ncbi:hypothetical protein LAZ67_1006724 [Cordylochernes scorpioides]|uniref:Retroviral polymerase SH3-like domain-containing protein n=1 Tax=Cordylochernes scorpioides TaxID=51811 RepID=A0ABY6JZ04_9ARAC|nr:hypothetical protein LAZ67_1006724 [Cordylochernes scorpioides]
MIGYSGSGYRIWDPETDKVMISTDVTFDETLTKFDKEIISDQTEPKRIITESQDEEENPQTSVQSDKEESVTTRSGRIIKPPRSWKSDKFLGNGNIKRKWQVNDQTNKVH